jgi:hypothetical protein
MNPHDFFHGAMSSPLPAPFWFVEAFKVLGFTLHAVPMNLWYAGLLVALVLSAFGGQSGRQFGGRLVQQMPIFLALGINFGIVPLLFLQVAYSQAFYPATILMAWFWMAVIALLIPAYYGVYAYAWGLRGQMTLWRRLAGWLSPLLLIAIGFLFANAMSLTTNIAHWPALMDGHSVSGAALGTALNLADPTLIPRWLLMFGLALGTTAVWAVVDAAWLVAGASPDYQRWVRNFARKLYLASMLWAGAAGTWYVLGTWREPVRATMFSFPWIILTGLTAAAPVLPVVWMWIRGDRAYSRTEALLLGLLQVGVLAVNAVSRQVVQNVELKEYFDVAAQPAAPQWGPLAVFLSLFVLAIITIIWMLAQVACAQRRPG